MQQTKQEFSHNISLKDRKKLNADGVKDVESFDEDTVSAMLEDRKMIIKGKHLKVEAFSSESGELCVEGEVDSITYTTELSRKAGLLSRMLK